MKPSSFDYLTPSSVKEAVGLLERYGDEAKILGGGQSLIPMLNFRVARPKVLVDINKIPGLEYIRQEGNELVMGGLTREVAIENSPLVKEKSPILVEAIRHIGHLPIRTRGTIAGSLVHADPSAELPILISALDGKMKIAGLAGERTVTAGDFFVTYLTSALEPTEILVEVRIPVLRANTGWAFLELSRRHGDFAIVAVACLLFMEQAGQCQKASITLGGVGPTPLRAKEAEALLAGKTITDALIREAAAKAAAASEPQSDYHASEAYRREMARVFTQRALHEALNKAKGGK